MDLREYQLQAQNTDQFPGLRKDQEANGVMVPLLGLAGEAGTLLTEYKKWLREGASYRIFKSRVSEELGDILWYVANIAYKEELDLGVVAEENLLKAKNRWLPPQDGRVEKVPLFDAAYLSAEQLPRAFRIEFCEETASEGTKVSMKTEDGSSLGNPLTDNAYESDGYRYHDVFHLSYAAVLGWSPVLRQLMTRKRKSNQTVDSVEDGGRAIAIEEGISALVFGYASQHAFLEGLEHVDYGVLRTIKELTNHLEVSECSEHQWQSAILQGFSVWRKLHAHRRGIVVGSLDSRKVSFEACI